jgi:4'-phosphopantetheinyl transferase
MKRFAVNSRSSGPDEGPMGLWTAVFPIDGIPSSWCGVLSAREREVAERRRTMRARGEFVAARILLRSLLEAVAGRPAESWDIRPDVHGALHVPVESGWFVNLSHTRGYVGAIASDHGPVGIDIEAIDHGLDIASLVGRFLHAQEAGAIAAGDPAARTEGFYRFWTLKEAAVKALGRGVAFDRFSVPSGPGWREVSGLGRRILASPLTLAPVTLAPVTLPVALAGAVAVASSPPQPLTDAGFLCRTLWHGTVRSLAGTQDGRTHNGPVPDRRTLGE